MSDVRDQQDHVELWIDYDPAKESVVHQHLAELLLQHPKVTQHFRLRRWQIGPADNTSFTVHAVNGEAAYQFWKAVVTIEGVIAVFPIAHLEVEVEELEIE